MAELCLMASHGYPPGLVLHQEQGMTRVIKDCQPYLPYQGARQEITRSDCLNLRSHQSEEPRKAINDTRPDLVYFSFGIAEKCARHQQMLQFLMSRCTEAEGGVIDLSSISDLIELQTLTFDVNQQPLAPSLVYPITEFYDEKPFLDFVEDMARSSKITFHPDGRVLFTGSGTEMNDFLSVVAEFYLSRNTTRWSKQSLLIPHFDRLDSTEAQANIHDSALKIEAMTVAPLKSPEKMKVKPRKKNSKKIGRERDLYKRNYFHACESLLSLMINNRQNGKTAIHSLKKSGPELPELLTQLSAGIAGTGLAVLFSVICKVACGRVPFCAYKLFNAGLAFGLVWLSWAVNRLRDTVVFISKNAGKMDLKGEEMIRRVEKSVNDIYFRAATVMALLVLRLV